MTRITYQLTEHELNDRLAQAWRQGYAAGWKDQECDFPPHTSSNPYTDRETGKDLR